MQTIPDSGFYYPNLFIRIMLLSIEDVAGTNGVKTMLNMAGLPNLIGNYPPANMEGEFDFSHYSMIMATLDDLYGAKGGQLLATRAGGALFDESKKLIPNLPDMTSDEFLSKSQEEKIEAGLCLVHSVVTQKKTISIPRTEDGQFLYSVEHCPICWGRTTSTPRCYLTAGLLKAAVSWSTGGLEFDVKQVKAHSCGDSTCAYVIPVTPAG